MTNSNANWVTNKVSAVNSRRKSEMETTYLEGGGFKIGRTLLSLKVFSEESPDRKGHPAAESAGRSNLRQAVTENYRPQG